MRHAMSLIYGTHVTYEYTHYTVLASRLVRLYCKISNTTSSEFTAAVNMPMQ